MNLSIRLLREDEFPTAEHIFRLAFGTFIALPQPTDFCGDANYVQTRSLADPTAAFAAEVDGKLVGSNIAVCWGSVGFFGPLSVHPNFWGQGIAKYLIESAIDRFSEWDIRQAGLFTFSNSPKHHGLYQKFGFYPRFLTFMMVKSIQSADRDLPIIKYSELNPEERSNCLKECCELTDSIYEGLDLSREIVAVHSQNLGDTVLLQDDKGLAGFAVCHCGAGSEAGSNVCYVKFGAVRSGMNAVERFEQLLDICEAFGETQKMLLIRAGINTSRDAAYMRMLDRDFRTESTGIAMHRPNDVGYCRSDVFVLDDWR
ncbi:MAG: GNAT family N-acetyltransferase [Oscillatoriaceae cyanobacterium Prado104]|jgi:GNAT superfamily N-acetyltransferase|nr:GNAT family N-acetyltransferase [Oscillatoriaceae cyanobacterium Prado104]